MCTCSVIDSGNNKRRLQISTIYGRFSATPLQAKIPLDCVPVDQVYVHVCHVTTGHVILYY